MPLYAVGLNHQTAPLSVREQVVFQLDTLATALRDLLARPKVREAAILSTCNRTEVYFNGHEVAPVVQWLEEFHRVPNASLAPYFYTLAQDKAVSHAFRVAAGLDSMVLGEPQILGQMKEAVRGADEAGTLGTTLHQLFQRSFSVAKEVRSSTEIGAHSISMAAATVRLAAQLFEDLREIKVLFVGAGEMIELVATHFAARTPRHMALANRTLERGEKLASRFGAQAL